MPDIKWWHSEDIQSGFVTYLVVPSFSRNGSCNNFIVYCCVPKELYVILVLHCFPCARIETARTVRKMSMQLTLVPHLNTAVMAIFVFHSQSRSLCRLIGMCGFSPVTGEGRRGFFLSVLVLSVLQIVLS